MASRMSSMVDRNDLAHLAYSVNPLLVQCQLIFILSHHAGGEGLVPGSFN